MVTGVQTCALPIFQRGVTVLPKSSNPQRIKENFEIFDFELTNEEMEEISKFDKGTGQFSSHYDPDFVKKMCSYKV